jgi:hypothetical protein
VEIVEESEHVRAHMCMAGGAFSEGPSRMREEDEEEEDDEVV